MFSNRYLDDNNPITQPAWIRLMTLTVIVILSACSKPQQFKSTKVSGEVINGITRDVFTRGAVNLIETETPLEPFTPITETIIDQKDIGNDGSYSFDFNAKRGSRYSYKVEIKYPDGELFGPGGEDGNSGVEFINVHKKDELTNQNFIIFPFCEIKLIVYNENPFDQNDQVTRFVIHESVGKRRAGTYIGGGGHENEKYNDRADFVGRPAGDMTLEWHVTRNGQTEVFSDEIYVEHNERRVYEIYY